MRSSFLGAFLVALLGAPSVAAQPVCTVGKPCGNACIDRDDTCHIDGNGSSSVRAIALGAAVLGAVGLGIWWFARSSYEREARLSNEVTSIWAVVEDIDGRPTIMSPGTSGLEKGDQITHVNDVEVRSALQIENMLKELRRAPGDPAQKRFCLRIVHPLLPAEPKWKRNRTECLGDVQRSELRFRPHASPAESSLRGDLSVGGNGLFASIWILF